MPIDKNEVESALDELIKIITDTIKNEHKPTSEQIIKIFDDNVELREEKALLNDEEVEELTKIILKYHPVYTEVHFLNYLREFKKQHFDTLKKSDEKNKETKEEQDKETGKFKQFVGNVKGAAKGGGGAIGRGLGAVKDTGLALYDSLRRRLGPFYYYVWWRFDNEQDYQTLVNDPHVYPRTRGKIKPYYKEIGNKDIEEALAGHKESGKVEGQFLGALGIVGRNVYFEDPQPGHVIPNVLPLKEGEVIALGAARAKRWDWRTRDYRGLGEGKLMRFDVERLIWKWDKWDGGGGPPPETVVIRGRLVIKDSWTTAKPTPANHDNPAALDWAKKIVKGDEATGLNGHEVTIEFRDPSAKHDKKQTKTATLKVEGKDVEGIFEFKEKDIPKGSQILNIKSGAKDGYKNLTIEFMENLPLVVNDSTQEAFMNLVLSKKKLGPSEDELILLPTPGEPGHKHALEHPFGVLEPPYLNFTKKAFYDNNSVAFKVEKSNVSGKKHYHVFFINHIGRVITLNDLNSLFNIQNIKVVIKGDGPPVPKDYTHYNASAIAPNIPFYQEYSVKNKVTVDISGDYKIPDDRLVPKNSGTLIFVYVSIQKNTYNAPEQMDLDMKMHQHFRSGSDSYRDYFKEKGVLEFNVIPVILHK